MTTPCHKARSLVSVGLDAPLNDLEQHFLSAHVGRCGVCRAFQLDAQAFTTLLREAPLEAVPWPATASLRGRRSRVEFRTIAQIASVACVMIAAGTIALAADLPGVSPESSALRSTGAGSLLVNEGLAVDEDAIRLLRREALVRGDLPILSEAVAPSRSNASDDGSSGTRLKPPLSFDGG